MRRNREGPVAYAEEIELLKVLHVMWSGRWKVLAAMIIAVVVAVGYLMIVEPEYEARVYIQPVSQDEISSLNVGRGGGTGLDLISVNQVYTVFLRNLQSESARRKFYREVYLPALRYEEYADVNDARYRGFSGQLQVALVDKAVPTRYSITIRAGDGATAVDWVSKYAEIASDISKREILRDAKSDANIKADNIELQIDIAKQSAKKQREDQIAQLKEALIIATSIGLEKPPLISTNLSTELSTEMRGGLTYMRGSKALAAEIRNLEERESDDPYIADLRKKQADLAFYRGLRLDPASVRVYQQDGGVVVTDQPVAPRRGLVLILSVLAGLLVGAGVVTGQAFWNQISAK